MKNRLVVTLTAGALAAIAIGSAVIPAAAAKAQRGPAPAIHRPARVNAEASPAAPFRTRAIVPVSKSQPYTYRAPYRAAPAFN